MPYSVREGLTRTGADDWSTMTAATFVQLSGGHKAAEVEAELASFVPRLNSALSPQNQVHSFGLDNLQRLTRNRKYVQESISGQFHMAPMVVLGGLSGLLLLLACFNYMNITIAQATRRIREIGVRKVVGARRIQVAFQFLAENLLLCAIALLLGLGLAWVFVLPAFNNIVSLNLEFALLSNWGFWIFLAVLVLGTGLVSGLYPAVYISSFAPTIIFRGLERFGRHRPITTAFQGFQFMLAFLSLAAGTTLVLNGRYYASRSAGYDTENTIVFRAGSQAEMDVLTSAVEDSPSVSAWTTAENAIGSTWRGVDAHFEGVEMEVDVFGVSPDYPGLMDIDLVAGQSWAPPGEQGIASGPTSVLVNETFLREVGLDLRADGPSAEGAGSAVDATASLGRFIEFDSTQYAIAGVLEDYHYEDFFAVIQPAVFLVTPRQNHQFVIARTISAPRTLVADQIASRFESAFETKKAQYFFQGDMFSTFRRESGGITAIFLLVSIMALVISCLSIYALSAQNVLNHLKEVGVRKVLGGQPFGIAQRLNRGIVLVLTIAAIVSAPLGYRVLEGLLDSLFAYHMAMSPMPFILAFAVIAGATVLTISIQVRSIHRAQPAEILG